MNDHVIDTNVLLVASAVDPSSPFGDAPHVPLVEQRTVFEWLAAFRVDGERRLVLDDCLRIYEEYRHQLSEQDYGLQVIHERMQDFRPVRLTWEDEETAAVPQAFTHFDRSDRKLLAAALTDPETISIVNAADSDWLEIEAELQAAGVRVIQVIDGWLRARKAAL